MLTDEQQRPHASSAPVSVTPSSLMLTLAIAPDAMLVVDQGGSLVMVNKEAEALFGYAHDELHGQLLEVLLPTRFHAPHRTHLKHYFSAPHARRMGTGLQLFGKRKDESEFPVDLILRPIMLDGMLYVIGAVRDETKKKWLEEIQAKHHEDAQSLSKLNMVLSALPEFVYTYDKQGWFRFVSEKGAALLGMTQSQMFGKSWQELGLPAEYMEPFEVYRRRAMTTGRVVIAEVPFPVVTGMRWFEFTANPIVDKHGDVELVVVASRDITERKQAEDALHRLASIVESSGEAIISKTLEGVITSWNSSAQKLYGYTAEEAIGQSVSFLIPPDYLQELPEIMAQVAEGKTIRDHDTTRVRKDGTHIQVSITISPIPDHKGNIIGASTIAHDITESKRLTRELESKNAELLQERNRLVAANLALEEANRARSQFLSTMSHELRTPLASIIGFAEMLLEDVIAAGWSPLQRSNLESILSNSEHLLDLINDVLDLAKMEAGRMVLDYSPVDVGALLGEVAEEIRSLAGSRHLFLKTQVQEGIDNLETNATKLRQILLNLLSNAFKFTEQGGVTLSARRLVLPDQETEGIAFAVQDSGIGISADVQAHIFEAFYQADMSYTRKVGGTGLGLSIVSQLTALMGGTVTVESTPGQGSTFTVTLPLKAAHPLAGRNLPRLHPELQQDIPTIPSSTDERVSALVSEILEACGQRETTAGQRELILVVDDNPEAIVFVKTALQGMPYTVVGVQDPLAVMELAQELHPSAITLDVMMPRLNGWQLLHHLKDNPATASIPVVMLTVLSEQMTGYVLGADEYLIKPCKKEALQDTLQHVIEASKHEVLQVGSGT